MDTKMTRAARAELADVVRRRYSSAASKDKSRILDEFIAATGYHEKSAIRVLNSQPARKHFQTRRRPPLYDEAARAALIVLWEAYSEASSHYGMALQRLAGGYELDADRRLTLP